ncbi:MAG: hypothetical protein A2314_05475 [Elusimicrobia bacterium RIFOXYB2_FULL_50_12]|nr:MAG: hypothetical protein A2314_05475 [Elusimicrobia bacterium RIFOXYB2_FULL_50_12]
MCKKGKCNCNKSACGCPSGRTPRFLQPSILLLLSKVPSHGYELMENLRKGRYLETKPDPGAVYRILRRLENDGCVKADWQTKQPGPAKKVYEVTASGKKLLREWAKSIRKKRESLDTFLSEYNNHVNAK